MLTIVLSGFLAFSYGARSWPFTSQQSPGSNKPGASATSSDPASTTPTTSENSTDPTTNSVKNQDNTKDSSPVTTNLLSVTSIVSQDGNVTVRTLISKVTTQGACALNITNSTNGKTYRGEVGVRALASSSTCQGFTLPISELSGGSWVITIEYIVDGVSQGKVSQTEQVRA